MHYSPNTTITERITPNTMATMQPGVRELGATALTCSCWGGRIQATFPSFLRLPPPPDSLSLLREQFTLLSFSFFCVVVHLTQIIKWRLTQVSKW